MYGWYGAQRLRESEINYVFCEWELFYPLATKQYTVLFLPNSHVNLEPRVSCALHNSLPRAKDEKRQKTARTRCPCRFSNPSERNKLHPPPFARGAKRFILIYLARFSRFIKVYSSAVGYFKSSLVQSLIISRNAFASSLA